MKNYDKIILIFLKIQTFRLTIFPLPIKLPYKTLNKI
jgi:hypothetical protein